MRRPEFIFFKDNQYMLTRLHKKNLGSKGVTLVELLVVIAILGILGAVALPAITGTLPQYRLRAEARELVSNFKKARLEAVKRNRNVLIEFYPTDNMYRIFVDMNDDLSAYEDGVDQELFNWTMRPQTELVGTTFVTDSVNHLTGYNSRGLPVSTENGTVTLQTEDGTRGYVLTLGRVGIPNLEDE